MAITRKAVAAAAFVAATTALGATPAAATVSPASVAAPSDKVCEPAHGPGDFNKHCNEVVGNGLSVDSVHGFLLSSKIPYYPAQICRVKVTVWGEKANGQHYENSRVNNDCGLGSLGVLFPLNNTQFKNGSLLCTRTSYEGYVPAPACVTIRA
ncbi:hypothetical protein [Actinokineospora iranica]|uniref:Secreted protein n=1 Tax=Actinokineospora iranica TaxID=1271860 RepID=A0A1G6VAA1_9PSEU|nr:hypothetical protein [Actinokineospora iranica]SDD50431.1 hypothetical protein SAMN05216174_11218 [Actinokineospora iranica]